MSLRAGLEERWPLPGHDDLRDELLAAWDRDGYHDLRHLREVLERLEELGEQSRTVALAAWFHDAVYDGADDDEERSAQWAERALPVEHAEEVARLVRLTVHHRPADDDAAGCALSDADLAILAAVPERYAEYVAGVRADFAHVADADFRTGRLAVLQDLASKPTLFHSTRGRELWEAPARANLEREIAQLSSGV